VNGADVGSAPTPAACQWHRASVLEFAPLAEAVPIARGHARSILHERGLEQVADDAELVLPELLTNAVTASAALAARPMVRVALLFDPGQLIIEVFDSAPGAPVLRVPSLDEAGGRGLAIVDQLARRWDWTPHPTGGKTVWADFWVTVCAAAASWSTSRASRSPWLRLTNLAPSCLRRYRVSESEATTRGR
jgi:anti-sigma regulatory factor (Ser/Thr protein kinase)